MTKYWIAIDLPFSSYWLSPWSSLCPLVRHNSLVHLCRQIAAKVPPDQILYAYKPDEALRGAVPFYTGRYIADVANFEDVVAGLQKKEPFFIIVRYRKGKLDRRRLHTGNVYVIASLLWEGTGFLCSCPTGRGEEATV